MRSVVCLVVACLSCGRDRGVTDDQLAGLVTAAKPPAPIDVDQAAKDPAELSRALAVSHDDVAKALGPHALAIETHTIVEEGGKPVSDLADKTLLELGEKDSYHGLYENSADYGREVIYQTQPPAAGKLYLRPRYQKWHGRSPEIAEEPAQIRDSYFGAIAATWELLAPGAELTDKGGVQVAGRAGRKIAVRLAPSPRDNPLETLSQRKWREGRTIAALAGEVTLDADKGVPLAIDVTGTVHFSRDGRRFVMKLAIKGAITKLGPTDIVAPAAGEVIATPTRRGEVDERDYLLHGIAPPIRKSADGTAPVNPSLPKKGRPEAGGPPNPPETGGPPRPPETGGPPTPPEAGGPPKQ